MCDIVQANFGRQLAGILSCLSRSAFIAVDLEFTGLGRRFNRSASKDLYQNQYSRVRFTASRFAVTQVGLSCFEDVRPAEDRRARPPRPTDFRATTFNVNVFPPEGFTFHCEPGALAFLADNSFDFNKFVREGVPYASQYERERQRRYLQDRRQYSPAEADMAVAELTGFCHVMEAVFRSPVPVIGHNMLYDLAFLASHFDAPLPQHVADFKGVLRQLFSGGLVDTKHLARHYGLHNFGHTSLGLLFEKCGFDVHSLHAAGHDRYMPVAASAEEGEDSSADGGEVDASGTTATAGGVAKQSVALTSRFAHEAGFDAFMTGCVLLDLLSRDSSDELVKLATLEEEGHLDKVYVNGARESMDLRRAQSLRTDWKADETVSLLSSPGTGSAAEDAKPLGVADVSTDATSS